MQREREGLLVGASVGAALMLVVVFVSQSLIGSSLFSTKTATVTVTTSDAYEQVSDAYAYHFTQLSARNISAIDGGYESNSTVEWLGPSWFAGVGNYSGSKDIGLALSDFFGKMITSSLSNESQVIGVEGNIWVVNSTFNFRGYEPVVGNVNGTIVAHDMYEHVGGSSSWLISREIWNFTELNFQYYIER